VSTDTAATTRGQDEPYAGRRIHSHPDEGDFENPFKQRLTLREDLASSAKLVGDVLPLLELSSRVPASPWWHYGTLIDVGSIHVMADIHPPLRMTALERDGLTVFIGYEGRQQVHQESQHWSCPADGCLILSGESFSSKSSLQSAIMFRLSTDHLLHTATTMAGLEHKSPEWDSAMQRSHAWSLSGNPDEAPLQALLRQELGKAHDLLGYSHALLGSLQIDAQIYRLIAALMLPDIRLEKPFERLTQKGQRGRDVFDDLIDYIKLNLTQPLTLTMLERQSHYSRRALQYAFRERLGCTATQWIRSQRLDLARRHLERPAPGDSVAGIATLCGYRSLSLFSVEFQQRFHVKPSQLLREALASKPTRAPSRSSGFQDAPTTKT
jgi:hypothetical protein